MCFFFTSDGFKKLQLRGNGKESDRVRKTRGEKEREKNASEYFVGISNLWEREEKTTRADKSVRNAGGGEIEVLEH